MQQSLIYALRLAVRGLARARGTTLIAMITLGGGLAAAVVLLGVLDAGTRPLPVPDGGNVVALDVRNARAERLTPATPVAEWAVAPGIMQVGAIAPIAGTILHPDFAARRAYGAAMHASVLTLLRVPPALGRIPGAGEPDAGTLLLGWALYEELGADPSIIGAAVQLDGRPLTVIGVMPDGFGFPENQRFWTVLPEDESGEAVVRLAPGSNHHAVGAAVAARLDAIAVEAGGDGAPHRVAVQSWTTSRDGGDGSEAAIFAALSTLVLLLLLVCCANVATLLLVRGIERANLLAVQSALGATRAQVTFQLFIESVVIALGGGLIGLGAGVFMLRMMQLRLSSHWGYYWMTMEVRPPVLLATFGLVLLTALLAGTVPAIRASRVDLTSMLASSGRGRGDPRQRRLGRWFLSGQVVLSSLGLIAAIYMAREFNNVGRVTERLPVDNVVVAQLTLPGDAYDDPASRTDLRERLRAELQRIPGVTAVSVSAALPGGRPVVANVILPGDDPEARPRSVQFAGADAHMMDLYQMRLVAGQPLPEGDLDAHNRVLVSTGFAQRHFDGAAIGRQLRLSGVHGDDVWAEVIGVFEDWFPPNRHVPSERIIVPLHQAWRASLYVSLAGTGDAERAASVRLRPDAAVQTRATGTAADALAHVRAAVRRVDERIPVEELQTLRARMDWFNRMMKVIAGFGAIACLGSAFVAAIGLYGVMSFQVRTRRREIGIRMAVGAAARRIMLEIVRESVVRLAPGLVVGVTLAMLSVPLLTSRNPDADPESMMLSLAAVSAMAAVALLIIGVVAAAEPALRAARLDPQEVLRAD